MCNSPKEFGDCEGLVVAFGEGFGKIPTKNKLTIETTTAFR